MTLPSQTTSWNGGFDTPRRLFTRGGTDYELYERDDEFVLSVELPGFDPADIGVSWDDGVLNVAAEQSDADRDRHRTYYRRFRFPKAVDDEAITAEYTNGILEVSLPISPTAATTGETIPIET